MKKFIKSAKQYKWIIFFWIALVLLVFYFSYENYFYINLINRIFPAQKTYLTAQISEKSYRLIETKTRECLNKSISDAPQNYSHRKYSRTERYFRNLIRGTDHFNWKNSLLLFGLLSTYSEININSIERYCRRLIDSTGNLKEPLHHIDQCSMGNIFVELFEKTKNQKYLNASSQLIHFIITKHKKSETGTIPYRQLNNNLMLVDTLWISPFLIKFGNLTGKQEIVDMGTSQLKEFLFMGIDQNTGLPYHAYDAVSMQQYGLLGWTRGLGWLLISLAESLKALPQQHPDYDLLLHNFQELTENAITYQTFNTCFSWNINNPYSHIDTSGTSMIGYAIEIGLEHNFIDIKYSGSSETALKAVLNSTTSNGFVENALAECMDVGSYPVVFGTYNYAQGIVLAHFTKIIKRRKLI